MEGLTPMTEKTKEQELENLTNLAATLEKVADDVRQKGETLQREVKNLGDGTAETKKAVDDAMLKLGEIVEEHKKTAARIVEIEQTLAARREKGEPEQPKSMGQRFIESEAFKSFKGKGNVRVAMSRKDILNVTGT